MYEQACSQSKMDKSGENDYCTMCGREWCSVRINAELSGKKR
jgi:hypothetical protein